MAGIAKLALGLTMVALVAALAGCGGGGNSSSSKTGGSEEAQAPTKQDAAGQGADANGQSDPEKATQSPARLSKEFPTLGSLASGRKEASKTERAAASGSVEAFMVGRANKDWQTVCDHLSAQMLAYVEELVQTAPNPPEDCAASLALAAEHQRVSPAANTMTGPIDGLLVAGSSGYAVFHGKHGSAYLVSMVWEEGEWKVNTLEPMTLQ
jgi:hypothetical protein